MARKDIIQKIFKAGQPVSAAKLNSMARAIRANRGGVGDAKTLQYVPRRAFEATVRLEGEAYSIAFYPGYVAYGDIDDPSNMRQIDGIEYALNEDPQYHAIASGQAAYVKVSTDAHGGIVGEPTITIQAQDYAVTHYEPVAGEFEGADGSKIWKICDFDEVGELGQYDVKPYMIGHIPQYYSQRPAMVNEEGDGGGDAYNVMRKWVLADDEYKFRPLKQKSGVGEAVIEPNEFPEERSDIPIRRIKERLTDPQVHVRIDEGAIQIEGNSVNITAGGLEVADGLVVSYEPPETGGIWGTFEWFTVGDGGSENYMKLVFENGRLVDADADGITGDGTEASPYDGEYTAEAPL